MQKKTSFFQRFYVAICLVFFYLPILVTMIFSFNSSKSLTKFTGFSINYFIYFLFFDGIPSCFIIQKSARRFTYL